MREPPRRRTGSLLTARDWAGVTAIGIWMGGAAMVSYLAPLRPGDAFAGQHGRSIAFSLLALSPLFHAFNCRSARASIFALRPLFPLALVGAVVVSAGIHLIAILVPGLRPVFRTFTMDSSEWAMLTVLSFSIVPAVEILKLGDRLLFPAREEK
jgi:Ca2+-transporting ATPase